MSEYNRNVSSDSKAQTVPGTPMQQMWHILNFHEERLKQLSQHLHMQKSTTSTTNQKSGAQHLAEYNTLLQQVVDLKARVSTLEAEKEKSKFPSNVTLSIEENN
jgi:hypothetical protein